MSGSELFGKTIFITGASSGIGRALAQHAFRQGAHVIAVARRLENLEELQKELTREARAAASDSSTSRILSDVRPTHFAPPPGSIQIVQADVTQEKELKLAVQAGISHFGKIDMVIANAGFGVAGNLEQLNVSDYQRQFDTNVWGLLRTIYATLEELKKSQGTLVLIGSVASYVALAGNSPYSMSKAAVTSLAEALRVELKPLGIPVVLVSPGFVDSEIRRVNNQGVFQKSARDPVPHWLRFSTDRAARQILSAAIEGKKEIIITFHGKVIVFLKRHFPWLIALAIGRGIRGRPEPQ